MRLESSPSGGDDVRVLTTSLCVCGIWTWTRTLEAGSDGRGARTTNCVLVRSPGTPAIAPGQVTKLNQPTRHDSIKVP